jgi:hypothetical protein
MRSSGCVLQRERRRKMFFTSQIRFGVLIHSDPIGRRGGMVRAGSKKLEWVLPTITGKMIPGKNLDWTPLPQLPRL